MANQLSSEQLMLLENLMYVGGDSSITKTNASSVGEWVSTLNPDNVGASELMPADEWKNILNAVKADDTLMNMDIGSVHVDQAAGGGNGVSAVFVNPETKEAVFAFQGTAANEWKDDFVGGGPTDRGDGVSTVQQENALKWYQSVDKSGYDSVTVLGHSKGGNKAKYITVMDDSVDRCVAMDGQGFSDGFINKYRDRISQNQYKIENHNSSDDYVNLLLNDIGKKTYYTPQNIGTGGLVENHCPNAFFKFGRDGSFTTEVSPQSSEMQEMDQFLNSYIRSLPPEERQKALSMLGTVAEEALGHGDKDANHYIDLLLNGSNPDTAAYLLAYLLKYEQTNPEFSEAFKSLLGRYGMGQDAQDTIDQIRILMDSGYADEVLGFAGGLAENLPDWAVQKIVDRIREQYGIDLTVDEARRLVSILGKVDALTDTIDARKNGSDLKVKDADRKGSFRRAGAGKISVQTERLSAAAASLRETAAGMNGFSQTLMAVREDFDMKGAYTGKIRSGIGSLAGEITEERRKMQALSEALGTIARTYDGCEKKAAADISSRRQRGV